MDGQLFVLMKLSRTARSAAASGGLRSLTTSSTRTECCPSDQGRFLGVAQLSNQTAATLADRDRPLKIKRPGIKGNADEEVRSDCIRDVGLVVFRTQPRRCAKLAAKTGSSDRAVPGRRRHRCRRADGGGSSIEAVEPADLR